jgi:hypothetical protein
VRRVIRRDARIHSTGERGDSNGKESEGRKEEGGQEEIAPRFHPDSQLPISNRELGLGPLGPFLRLFRVHTVTDPDVANHIPLHQPIDDIHAVHHPAEHRVSGIEVWLR